ncbi:50S ribosomal protein L28 [Metamycoplasma hyosynoviae]|uniref:Large ribosomal subunit protein bL28 n=1 Tax=Metamycoplasma hyosynoviae TaxID=29559 RepID=A0A063YBJ6_9BACT|nr:50S ribosomal protein L28 [Metamycoplasma hyosynoviae]ASI53624.1 50S ribosomal protein L28 [Metamycoplasma hyosynoviae]KDE42129.1 50S ribosomal protein L28 [Metamycoplasma hyosynoviae]KDE42264.1 50S ribosomal protein L28 [Metamycoplasma hyosynoviae]KDE42403.1 50S ribosomal protein L28 [Metamycoplasma hyosynoviae]KDE43933.1 50S ribosomal protein L28 [Metamycoplasma hyosynoviae]
MPGRDRLTGQKALSGNRRSHALNATKRTFDLNLQKVTVLQPNGSKKTISVTAKNARTLKKYGLVA